MLGNLRHPLSLVLILALSACGPQPPASSTASTTPAAPTTPAAKPASADSIGVPECDDYLTKYQACVNSKVPEAGRAALAQSIAQTRAAWRAALAAPGAKDGLAAACKQAHDSTKVSLAAYGCTDF